MTLQTGLRARRLWFTLRAFDLIDLGSNPGSALRGAFVTALRALACPDGPAPNPDHRQTCPFCLLVGGTDPAWPRGRDLPRPFTIEPENATAAVGETWRVGVTLIGPAIDFEDAVSTAIVLAAEHGIGRGRGRSVLDSVMRRSPRDNQDGDVTDDVVAGGAASALTIDLKTPLRLTERGALVRSPDLSILLRRLLERVEALSTLYGDGPPPPEAWRSLDHDLGRPASAAVLMEDSTRWRDTWSGSRRSGRVTPTGGLVGQATWRGDLSPLLPWLRWGEVIHVGKNAVKGDGWIVLETHELEPSPTEQNNQGAC
ncbi:MAG: CRISPR system precrRNA processing endoribonuclease RAMP protein Cas6 [Dehalococcoidia bacterium]